MRRALSLVVPRGRAVVAVYPSPNSLAGEHSIVLAGGRPVRLAGGELYLSVYHAVVVNEVEVVRGSPKVTTIEYSYRILDSHYQELLAYHYHPMGQSWCGYTHLHVAATGDVFSGKAHLATGRVSLPAVIRMLNEDPSIPVVSLRPDWPRVLDDAQASSDS